MYALTHLLLGWIIGNYFLLERRDRGLAILAAVAPDLDAIGYIINQSYYENFHHEYFHSILFCIIVVVLLTLASVEKKRVIVPFIFATGSHFVGDLIGTNWGMPLLWPVSNFYFDLDHILSDQAIYGVINPFAAILVIVLSIAIMYEFKRTPWEIFSVKWDKRMVNFLTLPLRKKCSRCDRKAFFKDEQTHEPLCLDHVDWIEKDVIITRKD